MGARALLPDSPRPWTWADLAGTPEDGSRYEIIEGSLLVSPPPTVRHQLATSRLTRLLEDAAPADLRVVPGAGVLAERAGATTYVIPDVLVARAAAASGDERYLDPADVLLVVEVVSPSTVIRDTVTKRTVYGRLGIPGYWLVETIPPGALTVLALDASGSYAQVGEGSGERPVPVRQPFPLSLAPAALLR